MLDTLNNKKADTTFADLEKRTEQLIDEINKSREQRAYFNKHIRPIYEKLNAAILVLIILCLIVSFFKLLSL